MSLFDRLQGAKSEKINAQKQEGAAFLEENKKKEGVVTLPSGIQYTILKEGTGKQPSANSEIKAHYAGRLLDGKEFDSSYRRNQPFTARLTQLIKGWQEVLPMMPEGSKWRLWIPSDLAYGDNGVPGIPGGAVLDFEVELLQILR
ncbi:FKBP-type peptidyl-prolyl cis-trans isomerase [Flaviaesturariibacter amylovorans]|uniref:Peptidyl-prolyl cis-trans isomerase n=1 Tax=Flaviaesturariibacter amylovorans TaxID=1084520 RepID=A0ABP8GUT1_9BACT